MTLNRDNVIISVEKIDGFGKKPGLWIGTKDPNQLVKVASFGSEDKAKQFEKWLRYIIGISSEEVKWRD